MPDKEQHYLVSAKQLRLAVGLGTVAMIATVIVLYLLATGHTKGRFEQVDDSQFKASLQEATADLTGYAVDGDRARLDIDRAIELVAERGVVEPGFYVASVAEPEAPAAEEAVDAEGGEVLPDGEGIFAAVCAACHQATGQGIPAAFPPLAGHAPDLYAADPDFPVAVVLFGQMGALTVDGVAYNSMMPAHAHMSDAEVAGVMNYVMTAWGNEDALDDFVPYSSASVAEVRAMALSMDDVHDMRLAAGFE